ncbi:GNAT family N-acetyltransferase [Lacticaseibacillus pantheris]|uniref:GNAT family N-acetyltransferase n=1 Tax=Lacticaseibacillus pantheris TaxID=171523 RepID=UPI002659C3A5|nr:GNAT family N-acetyltransferase [Lacticaseibacillus pantheris]WKF84947.1 GNAT family N-acetyltransferase [Lacticaseibacillus pantheris]
MRIRQMTIQDDQAVADLVRSSLSHFGLDIPGTAYFDPQLDHLFEFYQQEQSGYFVLVDDNNHAVGGCGFAEYDSPVAELQKLYISPVAQGHGASRQLVVRAESAARAAGFQQMYLETHHSLTVACQLYPKLGYQPLPGPLADGPHTTMDRFFLKSL